MPKVLTIVVAGVILGLVMTRWVFLLGHSLEGTTLQSVSGELVAYDPMHQDLALRTRSSVQHFTLRDETSVHEGTRILRPADLVPARGCPTKVWYRDTGANSIASDVRISCARLTPHADPSS